MKPVYIIIGVIIICGIGVSGCRKYLTIPPSSSQLVTSSTFNNDISATSAVTYIYTQMMNNSDSYILSYDNGLLADELTVYSTTSGGYSFYTNEMTAINNPGLWSEGYNCIYQANVAIDAIQSSGGMSSFAKQQLTGECKFIRALWNFLLTNCYGNIPLVLTGDYSTNATIARSATDSVYRQIIQDLKDAKILLSSRFLDALDTLTSSDRVRPTKWAAMALLSRVYLYNSDYTDAKSEADTVIENNSLFGLTTLNSVFLANSNEAIWQLMIPQPSFNNATPDGYGFIMLVDPTVNSSYAAISPQLLGSFEGGDSRRTTWIDSITSASTPATTYYFPYKYTVSFASSPTEYQMVLRLAEQYLIRAEAEARMGDLGPAAADLNVIRNRANLSNSIAASESDLVNAILHERQVELFTEWGCRWFDLRRTGEINSVMSVITPLKGGSWSANDTLYPIPLGDITVDPKLSQNAGY